MNMLRVNTLSYVFRVSNVSCPELNSSNSCFLAIKYASKAMMKTDLSRGKESEGGSIILTASGTHLETSDVTLIKIEHILFCSCWPSVGRRSY